MLYLLVLSLMLSLTRAATPHDTSRIMSDMLSKIDTHSHFVPPFWREESEKHGYGMPDGMPAIPVSNEIFASCLSRS